ncbi:MAG: calcium-binding protein, partial [Propionicimonas sp.]
VLGFADAACPPPAPGQTGFAGCGVGAVMLLSGGVVAGGERTVHVAKPLKVQADAPMTLTEDPLGPSFGDVPTVTVLTRHDGGSFVADGFLVGMQVWITAVAGPRTITALDAATLTLGGTELTGLYASTPTPITVFGYDPALDGGVLVGGDTIIVCNPDAADAHGDPVPCGDVVGGPDSPLVIYGDTSQDGVWYSGDPATVDGRDFGLKPYDPFYSVPDEDETWVFPVADPYDYAGNDVIDAAHLFAAVPVADLPTVGLTIYGGAGNDTIIGSQAGDHLAGGSGEDTILGQGGLDHIFGDNGINVDVLTRALSVPSWNTSSFPMADDLTTGRDTLYGDGRPDTERLPGTDLIFGDYGRVVQDVVDPHLPDPRLQRIQTTAGIQIAATDRTDGEDDTIFGSGADDYIFGGTGDDVIDAGHGRNLIVGDNGMLTLAPGMIKLESSDPLFYGNDRITAGDGGDVIIAGTGDDVVFAGNGDNFVAGDNGRFIEFIGLTPDWSILPVDITRLETTDPTIGGVDAITTGTGIDVVIAGTAGDLVRSGAGDDVVLGDNGGFDLIVIDGVLRGYRATVTDNTIGGNDLIYGQADDDLLIGGTGGDDIDGGAGIDLIFGDNAAVERVRASGYVPAAA